jgi:MFS transporter, DHA2 family, multidrug resistance protein
MAEKRSSDTPLPPAQRAIVTVSLALAVFMNVLDVSIANVSIPTISGDLGVSSDDGTWIITSFSVANAVAVPISGWLARQVGEVRLFIVSTLLFTFFSVLCGLAPSFPLLLAARILQGATAGPMIPLSQSLLLSNYPEDQRGFANGIWGMTAVVGPVAGPILGGWITDNINWSWIFYINLPFGLAAAFLTWIILRRRETQTTSLPLDLIGLALLLISVTALQVMLDKGNDDEWFQSSFITINFLIALIGFSFFAAWELTEKRPIVDLRLLGQRNFAVACIIIFFGYMSYFAPIVVLPLWLQNEQGYTPTWAGFATASFGVLGVIFSPLVGRMTDKIDLRWIVAFGLGVFAITSLLGAFNNSDVNFNRLFLQRLPWGLGTACFFIPLITLAMSGMPPEKLAGASGLFNFLRQISLSFGTNLGTTIWDHRATFHDHRLNAEVTVYNPATHEWLNHLQSLGYSAGQANETLAHTIQAQAYVLATNDIAWGSIWVFAALTVLIWVARPANPGSAHVTAE